MAQTWQWRRYTVQEGMLDQFIKEWEEHLVPLRLKFGYQVHQAWRLPEADSLLWLVSYEGPKSWEEVFEEFRTSDDRKAIEPDPARLLVKAEAWIAEPASASGSRFSFET